MIPVALGIVPYTVFVFRRFVEIVCQAAVGRMPATRPIWVYTICAVAIGLIGAMLEFTPDLTIHATHPERLAETQLATVSTVLQTVGGGEWGGETVTSRSDAEAPSKARFWLYLLVTYIGLGMAAVWHSLMVLSLGVYDSVDPKKLFEWAAQRWKSLARFYAGSLVFLFCFAVCWGLICVFVAEHLGWLLRSGIEIISVQSDWGETIEWAVSIAIVFTGIVAGSSLIAAGFYRMLGITHHQLTAHTDQTRA